MLCTAERIKYNEDQEMAIALEKMKVIGELKGSQDILDRLGFREMSDGGKGDSYSLDQLYETLLGRK